MKKIEKLLDIIELYVPMLAFAVTFISYVVIIAYRYLFYASIQWLNELSIVMYSWSAILAFSYCERKGESVSFSILFDKFPLKLQSTIRIIGNIFIAVTFAILTPYAYSFISFMSIKKTAAMKVPFSLVYAPFIVFSALTCLHAVVRVIREVRALAGPKPKEEEVAK